MYISGSGNRHTKDEMLNILRVRIDSEKKKGHKVKIIVGGDSQAFAGENGSHEHAFAIAIALHIVGNGGIFFIRKFRKKNQLHISEQLFTEVSESLNEANQLKDCGLLDRVDAVEIHCDAGNNGESRNYASAIKGMIEAFGFKGYIKPHAAIASKVADKYTK
jgi:predicted RNase H-related nuclease YkuK (DUF458 family)